MTNKQCLEYAKRITPQLTICGVNWSVKKITPQNGVYGLCDHANKIIYYSDNESLVHEYVHAWLYHNDNKNCGDEYAVMRITNMIINRELYGGKMMTKIDITTPADYDNNGNLISEARGVVYKCIDNVSFEMQMTGNIPWIEVGEMSESEYIEWTSRNEEKASS